jgi:hypothetical protein
MSDAILAVAIPTYNPDKSLSVPFFLLSGYQKKTRATK